MHISLINTRGLAVILFLLYLFPSKIFPQVSPEHFPVRIMFYNVENFFDIFDDPLKDDDDFLPGGLMRWNLSRYNKKINAVYKTIIASGKWDPPAVVALCEVENRKVIEDLVYNTYLSNFDYEIIHKDSPDPRGIDICLIYRKEMVNIIDYKYFEPIFSKGKEFSSRSVLYSKCSILDDTVHLLVNHWPSRRGGVLAAENLRLEISGMVRSVVDSINALNSGFAKIVIMGDFNCTPYDDAVQQLIKKRTGLYENDSLYVVMVNLAENTKGLIKGTYRYRGIWETLDQIIVTPVLLDCEKGLFTSFDSFSIFQPEFLLGTDLSYPGRTPFSTYKGYRYQGGYSDHLPVLIDLDFRETDQQE